MSLPVINNVQAPPQKQSLSKVAVNLYMFGTVMFSVCYYLLKARTSIKN